MTENIAKMHAANFRPRMNEEVFQILLELIEKHFEALSLMDVEGDRRLSDRMSIADVPCARRVTVEQSCQPRRNLNYIQQYSCEETFDQHSNIRQVKISEILRTDNQEHKKIWQATIPYHGTNHDRSECQLRERKKLTTKGIEYMEVDDNISQAESIFSLKSLSITNKESERLKKLTMIPKEFPYSKIHDVKEPEPNIFLSNSSLQNLSHEKKAELAEKKAKTTKSSEYEEAKKKIRPLVPSKSDLKNTKKTKSFCNCWMFIFFMLLPIFVLLVAALIDQVFTTNPKCVQSDYYVNASKALRENIFGQERALSLLVEFFGKNSCLKIVALVGGIGVGKSYTGQITAKNFPNETDVFFYYPPLKNYNDSSQFSRRYCNLVIIDNLKEYDIEDSANFIKSIENSEDYCITFLLMFNMQSVNTQLERETNLMNDMKIVQDAFSNHYVNAEVIGYEKLSDEALEECIRDEGRRNKIILSDDDVKDIKKHLQLADTGCKGAYSKIQLL